MEQFTPEQQAELEKEGYQFAKRIDFSKGWFMANGKKYVITQRHTIERYTLYKLFESELGYGKTFAEIFESIDKAVAQLNETKWVHAAVSLVDLQHGMTLLEEKEPTVLKICALAMILPGENITEYDPDLTTQKIEDWKAEGIDMGDFFRYALKSLDGYIELYNKTTQSISELGRVLSKQNPQK